MNTYCIAESNREKVTKELTRLQKKAKKYSADLTFTCSDPYSKLVPIYEKDPDMLTITRVGDMLVEVFDLEIDGDIIQNKGYSIVARIEHLDGGNIVTSYGESVGDEWQEKPPVCEHCHCKRHRNLTYLVADEQGNTKQIGSTCLKDYCGIDPQLVGLFNELTSSMYTLDSEIYDFMGHGIPRVHDTQDALALSIDILNKQGYIRSGDPGSNKDELIAKLNALTEPSESTKKQAREMANAILTMTSEEASGANLIDVRTLLKNRYCKPSHCGYIAYAPVAYKKHLEWKEEQARREAEAEHARNTSEYVGEIGKRLTIDLTEMTLLTSWFTAYGTTYLYKFVDTSGNVLITFSTRPIETATKIKGTIKDHQERDGIKQTILTRCATA